MDLFVPFFLCRQGLLCEIRPGQFGGKGCGVWHLCDLGMLC